MGVFHPGSQHSPQTALAFQESGTLAWYATSVFYQPDRWPYSVSRWLPTGLGARLDRELRRRFDPDIDVRHVRQFGLEEWLEILATRLRVFRLAGATNRWGNRRFSRHVIRLIEREPVDVLWGFNTSSLDVFRWAEGRGIFRVLDQTSCHPRTVNAIMTAEYHRHPDYFLSADPAFSAADIALQDEEILTADLVVCGSEFCAETLVENGCPRAKIRVVPYGYDERIFAGPCDPHVRPAEGPVAFLFAGAVVPGKGVGALLEAFQDIPATEATLTLAGHIGIAAAAVKRQRARANFVGQVPHDKIVAYFRKADCLVFPSLAEGGGIVLYEAAASGCAIIQSRFCGDGVRNGRNGIILDEVTVGTIRDAVGIVISDRTMLRRWQEASRGMCLERTWSAYRGAARGLVAT